jgi:cyclophilin family peptidyl-prolyl cis-trans isomerase
MARMRRQRQQRSRIIFGAIAVLVVVGIAFAISGGSGKKINVAAGSTTTVPGTATSTTSTTVRGPTTTVAGTAPASVGCPKFDNSSPTYHAFVAAPPTCINPAKTYTVTFQTDVGTFKAVLDPKNAPKTSNSFAFLAAYHYFDGITFHRVIPGFVIQGGDPTGTGSGGPGYSFADELPKAGQYKVGSLAMANSGPNTNGSQFFVITGAQGVALAPSYSLFGMVTSGLDVVKKIEADGSPSGTPNKVHSMVHVTVAES